MTTKELKIHDESSAFKAIKAGLDNHFANSNLSLVFDKWPSIEIKLDGTDYDSTITPDFAMALVELQKALNRTYSLLANGSNSANRLSSAQKEEIQFKAKVESGSSIVKVDLSDFAGKLVEATVGKMTPDQVVVSVVSIAAMVAGVMAYKAYLASRSEDKKITEPNRAQIAMSEQETARTKILADALTKDPRLVIIKENFDVARNELVRGVADADHISFNGVTVDNETAKTIVTNVRGTSIETQLNGTYYVTEVNLKKPDEIKLGLTRKQDGKEFEASFSDHSLDGAQIQLLQQAEWGRTTVFLSINAIELRGKVTSARVISVTAPNDPVL